MAMAIKIVILLLVITLVNCFNVRTSRGTTEDETFLDNPKYLNYDQLTARFRELVKEHPKHARLYSIGRSVENRELWVFQINSDVGNRTLMTPMFKFVANMHGDESIGRQLTVFLAEYLLSNYGKVDRVTRLVDGTDIHLMPSLNPDGYEESQVRI